MAMQKKKKRGNWPYITGEKRRNRVRVGDRGGMIYIDVQDGSGIRIRRSLGHRDRHRAKAEADAVAGQLGSRANALQARDLRIGLLFDKYLEEVTPKKAATTQEHDRMASRLFKAYLGAGFRVDALTQREWDGFIKARRSGDLSPTRRGNVVQQVGNRTIERDLR
jgi:hypothetical protein